MKKIFLLMLMLVLTACEDSNISLVKNGNFNFDTSTTIGNVLESHKFFKKIEWTTFQDTQNRTYVQFESPINMPMYYMKYFNNSSQKPKADYLFDRGIENNALFSEVDCKFTIQFLIGQNDTFHVSYLGISVNGEEVYKASNEQTLVNILKGLYGDKMFPSINILISNIVDRCLVIDFIKSTTNNFKDTFYFLSADSEYIVENILNDTIGVSYLKNWAGVDDSQAYFKIHKLNYKEIEYSANMLLRADSNMKPDSKGQMPEIEISSLKIDNEIYKISNKIEVKQDNMAINIVNGKPEVYFYFNDIRITNATTKTKLHKKPKELNQLLVEIVPLNNYFAQSNLTKKTENKLQYKQIVAEFMEFVGDDKAIFKDIINGQEYTLKLLIEDQSRSIFSVHNRKSFKSTYALNRFYLDILEDRIVNYDTNDLIRSSMQFELTGNIIKTYNHPKVMINRFTGYNSSLSLKINENLTNQIYISSNFSKINDFIENNTQVTVEVARRKYYDADTQTLKYGDFLVKIQESKPIVTNKSTVNNIEELQGKLIQTRTIKAQLVDTVEHPEFDCFVFKDTNGFIHYVNILDSEIKSFFYANPSSDKTFQIEYEVISYQDEMADDDIEENFLKSYL